MLGGNCSPCCQPCTVSAVRALWESVQQQNCFLSFTTNIPKADPATSADVALATVAIRASSSGDNPAAQAANYVTNGAFVLDRIFYYEGHDAVNFSRVPLALNMSATRWNTSSGSGVVVFSTNSYPVACSVSLVFTSGGATCVTGSYSLSAYKRLADVRGGAGSVDGLSSGTVTRFAFNGEYSVGFAIASADRYRVSQFGSGAGARFSAANYPKIFYALVTFGRYSTASAWWESSKKPAGIPWVDEPIFQVSGSFQTVTQGDAVLSADGSFTSNSGLVGGRSLQWTSNPLSPTEDWCTSLSIEPGSTSFEIPIDNPRVNLQYGPFLRVGLSGDSRAYSPVGDPFVSGSITVVTE
jgi:hypothetical protein